MYSLRKWLYKPKRSDSTVLAQFFYADEDLNAVATELDSFDGRKDPERCTLLVNQLRFCQDRVLGIIQSILEEAIPNNRANRDFRVKFPDDLVQDALGAQLWFGAECLAAGSCILNREVESASMRPLAKALTKSLDNVRALLRDQCLKNQHTYSDRLKESLVIFDRLFGEFELSYVSVMVPVKTMKDYDIIQEMTVLFSETVLRSLRLNLLTQDMLDDYDPALMFTIPRLAIVCGLIIYPEGPLNPNRKTTDMSEMFRPFQPLLLKIRELMWTLSGEELLILEKSLCSAEEPGLYRDIPAAASCQPHQTQKKSKAKAENSNAGIPHDVVVSNRHVNIDPPHAIENRDIDAVRLHESASDSGDTDSSSDSGVPSDSDSIGEAAAPDPASGKKKSQSTQTEVENSQQNSRTRATGCGNNKHCDSAVASSQQACDNLGDLSSIQSSDHDHCDPNCVQDLKELCKEIVDIGTSCLEHETNPAYFCRDIVESVVTHSIRVAMRRSSRSHSSGSRHFSFNLPLPESRSVYVEHSSSLEGSATRPAGIERSLSHDALATRSLVVERSLSSDRLTPQGSMMEGSTTQFFRDQVPPTLQKHSESEPSPEIRGDNQQAWGDNSVFSDDSSREDVSRFRQQVSHISQVHVPIGGRTSRHNSGQCPSTSGQVENPRVQRLRCSDATTEGPSDRDSETESCDTSDTSSYTSECPDDDEIAMAMHAAEITASIRDKFRDSNDLIHRLFVCISGVADQLQTNYASDFRNILKIVFELHCSEPLMHIEVGEVASENTGQEEDGATGYNEEDNFYPDDEEVDEELPDVPPSEPPVWLADTECSECCGCRAPFTLIRRRHHCRHCGMIYCSRCSSNFVPMPQFGHTKPVRVCNHCFMFQVTPFTMNSSMD